MAEGLLSALLPMVIEKATNHALRQLRSMRGIREKLEELERKLSAIQSIIGDAEERQGEIHVKRWLEALKETAYQADDILEEFNVEVMRRKARNQADMTKKVRNFFSSYNPVWFRIQIGRKLNDIIEKIDKIKTEGDKFHFNKDTQNRDRPQTYSYVDESNVIGREEDREKILKLLLDHDNSQNFAVLPIVGMGGLGKTTLAQLIYKDKRVEKHFQPLIWVSVSDEFEVVKLAKAIITSATGEECDTSTMELLQNRLRKVLGGKRYFLVLDDVWNDDWDKWDGLKTLLETGEGGSKIIVTTRSEHVASIMGTLTPHCPQHLNENDSWTLFKKRAFKDRVEEPQNLVSIGKDIVKKCNGLPLAVNALGALMHSKSQEAEWLSVKNSEIWNLPAGDKVLSVLRLSYRDLPSYLKQCFAFCAIFPKDHVMEKETLIQLWMANGFIPFDEGKELQDKGNEIFNELAWRSFFQDVKEAEDYQYGKYIRSDEFYWKTTCKMHDLMHDLAQSIMGNECLSSLQHGRWEHISKKIRHLYIPQDFQLDINNFPNIRTLLVPNWSSRIVVTWDLLNSMPLRALKLCDANITELLRAITFLQHLRYLDLSNTNIEALPEAMSTLFNLQTLKLSNCRNLCKLPDDMRNMSNLRHLYINRCDSLKCLPTGMGQLRSLRTLTKYIVGNENGRCIDELNGLDLGGRLELYNLRNVKNAADASQADLSSKCNLCSLILCWDMVHWNEYNYHKEDVALVENAKGVLGALKPHDGLKLLAIFRYGGGSFPAWMMDSQLLQNLVEIHLEVCTGCERLPPLWKLRSLKFLYLKNMDKVKHICSNNESNDMVQAFPSLKRLTLFHMQSLEAWSEDEGTGRVTLVFPHLAKLEIIDCPNLMTMPELPSLASLEMEATDMQLGLVSNLTVLSSLHILIIRKMSNIGTASPLLSQKKMSFKYFKSPANLTRTSEDLVEEDDKETRGLSTFLHCLEIEIYNGLFSSSQQSSSPLGFWKNLTSLQSLKIVRCDDLVYWPEEEFRSLNSLKILNIEGCKNLIGPSPSPLSSSSGDGELLPNLEDLLIEMCPGLLKLPKLPASLRSLHVSKCLKLNSLTEGLGHATALKEIHISQCKSLTSLPADLGYLTALQSLQIRFCPLLSSLPEGLQRLPSLQSLVIQGCLNLERQCERGGPYWELVSQIPYCRVIS